MTLVAFISDTKTENGIQLHELATAPNVAGNLISQTGPKRNVVGLFGNSLEEFQSSGRKLEEIEVLVLSVFSGGRAEVISELWPHVKVKWIHCLSAGVDTLVPVLKTLPGALETPLTNAKGAFSRSLAEYSVAAMMYFNKQIPRLQANRASRTWEKFQMQELYGKTCGFVGFGDIAQTTAKLCRALGMRVLGWRNRRGLPGEELADAMFYAGDGPQAKEEVFKQSDFVICSLPGGEATYHACGAADFAVMKPSGVFLSLGRGTCVDEAALIEVLQKKKILGAALDVFEKEPLVAESPLWALDNVLLSSHNADLTPTYMNQTWEIFLENLQLFRSPEFSGFKNQVAPPARRCGGQVLRLLSGSELIAAPTPSSATAEELAAIPDARERALRRVARAVGGAERAGYGDFREASSREITLDATFEAFTVMMRAACHLKLNLTPESAVHTLQASKMYLIEKLERYCADYLYGLKDCTQILQAMTAAAKSCFCFVQELHRHYWTNILLQSSKVLASPAFQVAHGLIIDQLIKLDEFDVNEDDLWSCLVAWSANAVRQPEILGPFANTTEEVVKRSKTEGQESGAHEVAQQTAILRLMSQHIRFGAMTKEKFFDQARVHLTHEQNYEVIEHFWLGRTPQRVRASKRAGLVSEPEPAHHFAALGFSATEALTATPASVQKAVEDFEKAVGASDGKPLYTTALGRVKAAAKAVEAMLSLDSFGAHQLAELCYVMDDEGGILSQKRAASILGVEPGCGEAAAHAQVDMRYRAVLSNLASASQEGADRALSIMQEVVDSAARPVAQLWAPPPEHRGVAAARAMGLRDLKRPRKLVGLEIVSEVIDLEDNSTFSFMLLTDAMRDVSEAEIAEAVTLHKGGDVSVLFLLLWGFRWVEGTQLREGMQRSSAPWPSAPWPLLGALAALVLCAQVALATPAATEIQSAQRLPDWTSLLKPEWRAALRADEKAAWRRVPKSVLKRLRGVAADLADLRQDVYDEDWQNMAIYPNLFQAYLPVFTRYTDSAFPSQSAVDESLRFSLRYEVGAFYRHLRELEVAVEEKNLPGVEEASALMSLSYDRYLKAGDLYEGYDADQGGEPRRILTLDKIEFEPPALEPPLVRDEVVILVGPDKGQTGRVLWVARVDGKPKFAIVSLNYNKELQDSEVKTFNYAWLARTSSSSDQLSKDALCGFVAACVACSVVYPIDSSKVRLQTGRSAFPKAEEGGFLALYDGLLLNLGREAPNAAMLLAIFNFLKRAIFNWVLQLLNGSLSNATLLRFAAMVPAGAIADAVGSTVRVPFELMNKQVQSGRAQNFSEAFEVVFSRPGASQFYFASWAAILVRDVPYGTLQLVFFEFFKEFTPAYLEPLGFSLFAQRLVWGFLAGLFAGALTVPVDNVSTVVMTEVEGAKVIRSRV
ncbi:D-3-phosphoglycerate dehydrogenase (PGDH) [Durusdinium trenchii]|uniref:D-3-phosphoglycerate dehydrogenase (PGDH) n=1 Tax=Durusdinium trenchii TaxID=1381693 RepID=A0ABP0HWV9_9DINO